MSQTEAQKRAERKWNSEKVDSLHIRIKKGMREVLQVHSQKQGESVNAFVTRAIMETIERDNSQVNNIEP